MQLFSRFKITMLIILAMSPSRLIINFTLWWCYKQQNKQVKQNKTKEQKWSSDTYSKLPSQNEWMLYEFG